MITVRLIGTGEIIEVKRVYDHGGTFLYYEDSDGCAYDQNMIEPLNKRHDEFYAQLFSAVISGYVAYNGLHTVNNIDEITNVVDVAFNKLKEKLNSDV